MRIHIRSYVNNLGGLKAIPELPRRKSSKKVHTYTEYSILVGHLEDLVNFSIQDIVQPLDQLGPVSLVFQSPIQSPIHSPPQTPHRIMDGNVPPNPNQPNPPPAWRARTPLNLDSSLHALPQNLEKELPKFDLGKGILVDDHLQRIVIYEDGK